VEGEEMSDYEFKPFDKIARLNREVVVTEKIDGTNGLVFVSDDFAVVKAGSRSRWVTPEDDNFGFAKWVKAHEDELRTGLGPGYHYGEWWGAGIQRKYGLSEKRFSLFNVSRWIDCAPPCCHVVPTLFRGPNGSMGLESVLGNLRELGSVAAPGFMKPEGIVIYHTASGQLFKVTLEKDEAPKGKAA
jgi:hypothetical protein